VVSSTPSEITSSGPRAADLEDAVVGQVLGARQ
jgi:hypothetical protein